MRLKTEILVCAAALLVAGCSDRNAAPEATSSSLPNSGAEGASPASVVQHHVDAMKRGDLAAIMDDYAADAVVIAPQGLVEDQNPTTGPGVFSGANDARRVFATLTAPGNLPAVKGMMTTIEPKGGDVAFLHWTQMKGTPQEVSGQDVFVVRGGKVIFQDIIPDAK